MTDDEIRMMAKELGFSDNQLASVVFVAKEAARSATRNYQRIINIANQMAHNSIVSPSDFDSWVYEQERSS